MAKITEEEIIKRYALPPQKVEEIKETIIGVLSSKADPAQGTPLAIVVGGQSGSGKTALIDYTLQLNPGGFITIDNDFFRSFHPNSFEIERNYPELYTAELPEYLL